MADKRRKVEEEEEEEEEDSEPIVIIKGRKSSIKIVSDDQNTPPQAQQQSSPAGGYHQISGHHYETATEQLVQEVKVQPLTQQDKDLSQPVQVDVGHGAHGAISPAKPFSPPQNRTPVSPVQQSQPSPKMSATGAAQFNAAAMSPQQTSPRFQPPSVQQPSPKFQPPSVQQQQQQQASPRFQAPSVQQQQQQQASPRFQPPPQQQQPPPRVQAPLQQQQTSPKFQPPPQQQKSAQQFQPSPQRQAVQPAIPSPAAPSPAPVQQQIAPRVDQGQATLFPIHKVQPPAYITEQANPAPVFSPPIPSRTPTQWSPQPSPAEGGEHAVMKQVPLKPAARLVLPEHVPLHGPTAEQQQAPPPRVEILDDLAWRHDAAVAAAAAAEKMERQRSRLGQVWPPPAAEQLKDVNNPTHVKLQDGQSWVQQESVTEAHAMVAAPWSRKDVGRLGGQWPPPENEIVKENVTVQRNLKPQWPPTAEETSPSSQVYQKMALQQVHSQVAKQRQYFGSGGQIRPDEEEQVEQQQQQPPPTPQKPALVQQAKRGAPQAQAAQQNGLQQQQQFSRPKYAR